MIDFVLLLVLLLGGSWLAGWWALLLVAGVWGWWSRGRKAAWRPALAAALAWGFWLAVAGPGPTVLTLLDKLSQLFGAPGPVVLILPIGYAALLAWAAARLMQGLWVSRPE